MRTVGCSSGNFRSLWSTRLSTVVVIHQNISECCFSLWTKTNRSSSFESIWSWKKIQMLFWIPKKGHDYFLLLENHWETPPSLVPTITAVRRALCRREWMSWDSGGDTESFSFSGSHITQVPSELRCGNIFQTDTDLLDFTVTAFPIQPEERSSSLGPAIMLMESMWV